MKKFLLLSFLIISYFVTAQPVTQFQQFNGRYDFTAFGNTLNLLPNGGAPCEILTQSSADFSLPAGQTLVSAHLYWAGSGTGDFDVALNGAPVAATRTFALTFSGLPYFAAYAEVTPIVAFNGNGTYTLSELDLTAAIPPYCSNTNFGGWAIYIIYEDPTLTLNQISLFDGLEFVASSNPSLEIILTNIDIATEELAKIGFLAWEGEASLANNETLLINGNLISNPPLNPPDNAFNGTNSYTGSSTLWNMDLDFYDIEDVVNPGDTSIQINLTSSQDFVMVNNVITSVNSEIPDATITIDDLGVLCENNSIDVDYTVFNINSTAPLPADTPIAFYADDVLIGQTQTFTEIPIGGSESGTISLNIPLGTPVIFTLKAVVDDDGTGNGIVAETDETNNEFELIVDLNLLALNLGEDIESCIGDTVLLDTGIDDPLFTFQWFFNGNPIVGAIDPTLPVTVTGTYKVEAFKGICFVEDEIFVNFNAPPAAVTPTDLEVCDELPNDGFGIFDLTTKDAEIQNGIPNTFVTYFLTQVAAQAGAFPILNPTAFPNTSQGFQTVYARLESTIGGCFDVVPLNLQVNDSPAITDPISDYFICDNDGDGTEIFDLTSKDAEILNTLVNVTLSYHNSMADALSGLNPIATPGAYPSGGEVIWVRAINPADCVTVGSFVLVLGTIPSHVVVDEFSQCDLNGDGQELFNLNSQNAAIVNGNFNLSVSYHPTLADAQAATNALTIPYLSSGEIIFVRVEDNTTGCYATFEMELIVVPLPEIFEPDPLIYCDDDNDGFGEFILTDADEQVVNGDPSGNLVVSYHLTLSDAQNGVNALTSPFTNTVAFSQTVYVRLVDLATGCYNTTTLLLIVTDSPSIVAPDPLVVCDDDNDGFAVFDLTVVESQVLNGLDPLEYPVSYYEDPGLTIAITTATAYTNLTNPQVVQVVVENINTGCQSVTTLTLEVNLPPSLVAPTPLELCDVNNPGDEIEPFDLESKTAEITGGNINIIITYHESQGDADAGINALLSPYENVLGNPQTIYIRAVGGNSGCVLSQGFTLDLIVNPLPSPVTPTPLEVCDQNNDGFAMFDLSSKTAEIIGGEPGVSISYHETASDAELGIFPLGSPYENIVANMQTVYARALYSPFNPPPNNTGCFKVVELDLIVNPTPVVPLVLDPLVICDLDGNGMEIFDLTLRAADIYGVQDPSAYTLTYHETLAGAQAGTPLIGTPTAYTNTSNPQTIYVRLEDNQTECFKLGQFELQTPAGPSITQPTPLVLCDDVGEPNNGTTVFDLTVKNDEITGGAFGVGVRYYRTLLDAEQDTNVIDPDTAYENEENPQTIYIRVTDGNTDCYNTTLTLTLQVRPNPLPVTPDPLELCDENDPGDGIEIFDLTLAQAQILNGATWDVSYHESYQEAFENLNAIVDPANYPNTTNPQIIYVRVTNNDNAQGCFEIVELELIVNPLPDDSVAISEYIICELPFDGQALFDLSSKIAEILGGQDPGIFDVSFYESQAEADAMLNAILNTTAYPNESNPQTIYVGILNTQTDCYVSTQSFELEVREGALAQTPAPYAICDNLGEDDGIGEFALDGSTVASQELIDAILGGQDPSVYLLSFHETLAQAQAGTDALGPLYVNVINPQVIYARVSNSATECAGITEVILKVEQLPAVALEEQYRLCVDANDNPIPQEEGGASPPVLDTGLDPGLYSFEWYLNGEIQLGQQGPSMIAFSGGEYTVIVTELATGCITEATTTVIVSSPPFAYDARVVNGAFASSHTIEVTQEGYGTYIYQLDDGPFQDSPLFEGVSAGTHTITIKDANGCGSVTLEVGVIDYPRFVTPNQDGYHDTWNIIGIADGDPTAKIYIFDRFGKLLKQISPLGSGWDGTYNGNPLPSSDYWFLVEYTEDNTRKEFRGHFTLKR